MTLGPGEVVLRARLASGRFLDVRVRVDRPAIAPLLCGQSASVVATLVPLAYAVCARAQSAAALAALAAARGEEIAPARDAGVAREALRELVFSVFAGPARVLVPEVLHSLGDAQALRSALATSALGCAAEDWLALDSLPALQRMLADNEAPLAREAAARLARAEPPDCHTLQMPDLDAAGSLQVAGHLEPAFCAWPTFMNEAVETGPRARLRSHALVAALTQRPLLQRWIARLLELLQGACDGQAGILGQVSAVPCGAASGRAAVITARGLLLHEVKLEDERVAAYSVCAPTEWNFHPRGLLPRWLEGAPVASQPAGVEMMLQAAEALDPCVRCRIELEPYPA
jgi:hypothetical protein